MKSHFTAVISPHVYPSSFACIMWLIELLQYDEAAAVGSYIYNPGSMDDDAETDDPALTLKSFYRYVRQAYTLFLAGEDAKMLSARRAIFIKTLNSICIKTHINGALDPLL